MITDKLQKKWLIIFALFTGLIIIYIATLFFANPQTVPEDNDPYLEKVGGVNQDQWLRTLITDKKNDYTIITNPHDKYKIEVPAEWVVNNETDALLGLIAYKKYPANTYTSVKDGVELRIAVFQKDNQSLIDWLASSEESKRHFGRKLSFDHYPHALGSGFKAKTKVYADHTHGEDEDEYISNSYYEKSILVYYLLPSAKNIFMLSCVSIGENYLQYADECEQQIQTFAIIE